MATRGIGGGFADLPAYGVSVGKESLGLAGQAAQLEQQREAQNKQIVAANRAANVSLGSAAGGAIGYAAGASMGASYGSSAGPWGAAIGAVVGGLIGALF